MHMTGAWKGGDEMHEQKGYELSREIGVDADFLKMLVPVLEIISRPMQDKKKMRVVVDYEPHAYKVKFRYYTPTGEQDETEHQ